MCTASAGFYTNDRAPSPIKSHNALRDYRQYQRRETHLSDGNMSECLAESQEIKYIYQDRFIHLLGFENYIELSDKKMAWIGEDNKMVSEKSLFACIGKDVKISCVDGDTVEGHVTGVSPAADSEDDEACITIQISSFTVWFEFSQSEIERIKIIERLKSKN